MKAVSRPGPVAARPPAWAGVALVLAVAAAWLNSLAVPFVFDDVPAIVDNASIRELGRPGDVLWPDLEGGVTSSGRPLVNLSLAVNWAISGRAVWSYHVFNVLVHAAAALVMFGLLRRTLLRPPLAERWGSAAWPVALAGAAMWALHPLQTAAVTYVVQRAEAMAGLLVLLTVHALARAVEAARPGRWLAVSVGACLAGMATKETAVVAPLLVLLYDRTFVAGTFGGAWRERRGYYLALAATWGLLAVLVAAAAGRGGSAGFAAGVSSWTYLLTQAEAIVRYLGLVAWPHPLVFDYGTAVAGGLGDVWWQVLLVGALVVATGVALVRRPSRGFVAAWFLLVLAPSSSFVPVATQTMAEHRMYLALAAPVVLLVGWLHVAAGRRGWAVAGVLAGVAALLTVFRNADYASARDLWADTVEKRPDNARAHQNLGLAELARGRVEEALRHLRDAAVLAPHVPEPHYDLGVLLAKMDRVPEAIAAYEKVLSLAPDHAATHNNLAILLARAGRDAEAGRHHAEAVRLQPRFAAARNSLGNWLLEAGRPAEAMVQLAEAIRLQPGLVEAHFNAGNACAELGRVADAERHYRETLRLQPDFAPAHNNLGNLALSQDRVEDALRHWGEAVQLAADYLAPRRNLALLLLHLGRGAEARPHLEELARRQPGDPEIAEALGRVRGR